MCILILSSYMRPGTPHFVFGPEDTICYGGHFYATSQMQATLPSLIHSFVLGYFVTNSNHSPAWSLLRRIVLLYHYGLVEERFKATGKVPDIVRWLHPSFSFYRPGTCPLAQRQQPKWCLGFVIRLYLGHIGKRLGFQDIQGSKPGRWHPVQSGPKAADGEVRS